MEECKPIIDVTMMAKCELMMRYIQIVRASIMITSMVTFCFLPLMVVLPSPMEVIGDDMVG